MKHGIARKVTGKLHRHKKQIRGMAKKSHDYGFTHWKTSHR